METTRIDHALARLDAALARAESAAQSLQGKELVSGEAFGSLRERHDRLKDTVANSLKQLDEILAGVNQ